MQRQIAAIHQIVNGSCRWYKRRVKIETFHQSQKSHMPCRKTRTILPCSVRGHNSLIHLENLRYGSLLFISRAVIKRNNFRQASIKYFFFIKIKTQSLNCCEVVKNKTIKHLHMYEYKKTICVRIHVLKSNVKYASVKFLIVQISPNFIVVNLKATTVAVLAALNRAYVLFVH